MDRSLYSYIFIGLWLVLPIGCLISDPEPPYAVWTILAVCSLAFTWWRLGSARLSYPEGPAAVAIRWSSGCFNITITYIFFVLAAYQIWYTLVALLSLSKPRAMAQERFAAEHLGALQTR